MILINKVTPFANDVYQKDLFECLINNSEVIFISKIIVFYNNTNIVLPKNDKVKLVIKNGYTDKEIIEYCKRVYDDDVFIFSNPFIKFNNSLLHLESSQKSIKIDDDCYIFNKNIEFEKSGININELITTTTLNNKISIERKHLWTNEIKNEFFSTQTRLSPKPRRVLEKNIKRKNDYINSKKTILDFPKIDVIIVSVDYNDFLSITLKSTSELFNVTVVTSPNDKECQELCERYNVNCIITERMYENGAAFNKGKAINEGIKSLKSPEWILLLDADIYLKSDILDILKITDKTTESLLLCKRLIIEDYDSFIKWKSGKDSGIMERSKGFGYFQMFNINRFPINSIIFPENSDDAGFSDLTFRDKFNKNEIELDTYVVHLGRAYQNWNGRKTDIFLENEFDINKYFDKIYCINLKKRVNKWLYSNYQFINKGIKVERYEAIDGDFIQFDVVNSDLESLSIKGLIESRGAWGCLKTHLEIIEDAKLKKYKKILIFEDDILLSDNFNEEIKKIKKIDWKLLYLGASQFDWNSIKIENEFYKSINTLGTFAYALDISIYDEILTMSKSNFSKKSIDNILSDIQKSNDKCYTLFPNIVISDVSESDIRGPKSMIEYSKISKWNLKNFSNISYLERIKSTTIIIPCYGQSKYLEECIESCLSQSIRPGAILVLLMDEDSISMKVKIENRSNIIKCIISEKMKLSEARNFCVDKIETEYFIPLDADDKIPENFIEEICKIESDVVYIGAEYFGSKSGVWPDPITEEINWTKLTTFRRNSLVCTALIKKESFIKSGKYKESLWAFEDMDLWIRMYKNKFIFKKCFNTKLFYRKHLLSESLLAQANSSEENRKELKKVIMNDDFYKRTPKIIHWVWIGDNPIPEEVLETWKKNLPEGEWTYMLWNEKNFDMNSSDFLKKSYELKKYGICVDYIRAKVLYEYGGVWLDADCIINNDISPFLQYDFFSSWENENYLNIGLIGCKPKLEQIGNILKFYSNLDVEYEVLNSQNLFVSKVGTGPIVLTDEILKICDIRNGGFTKEFTHDENRFLIETPDVFVLDDSISGRINYAVHLFDGSWTEKKEKWSDVVNNYYKNWKIKNKI